MTSKVEVAVSGEQMRSSGWQRLDRLDAGCGGRNSIQEYAAANPYYPLKIKTLGVRIGVSTHADRPPPVRRHRRPILPNQSRVTARVRSRTGFPQCREASMSLRHNTVPVSPFVGVFVPGTTRWHTHDIRLPCQSVARIPQQLPSLRASTSTQATLPDFRV